MTILKPKTRTLPADLETPVSAFWKLRPLGAFALLESAERGGAMGRFSVLALSPMARLRIRAGRVSAEGFPRRIPAHPFAALRAAAISFPVQGAGPHARFAGAAIGNLAYDAVRALERLPATASDPLGLPEACLQVPQDLVIFDHLLQSMELVHLSHGGPGKARTRLDAMADALRGALPPLPEAKGLTALRPSVTRSAFIRRVKAAQAAIRRGDCFQIVLSQRLEGTAHVHPFQAYRALRRLNPSPYLFYLDHGDHQLVSASPETLIHVEGGIATTCPIAGTRPRGGTPEEDAGLEADLRRDPKELAEHHMLIDLGRNDLARTCRAGTVRVVEREAVARYSHVMHLTSRVEGRLAPGRDAVDALEAAFPAGTVTGAPKIRAMELIEALEGERRGPYAGAAGYASPSGVLDFAIAIRMLVFSGGQVSIQAGAGIVAASDPDREYEETLHKAGALARALELAGGAA